MSETSERITELKERIKVQEQQIVKNRNEIREIMKACPHKREHVTFSKTWEDTRGIVERRVTCNDCGSAWNEQKDRYEPGGGKWPYDLGEWPDPDLHWMTIF